MSEEVDIDDGRDIMSKAGAVVAALETAGELTAAQLAELVDEPVSSTYRLLQNLATIGWIEPGSSRGRFRLGVFFIRVGAQLEDSIDVRRAALPELRKLRGETGWTSFLCYRRGRRGVCVERIDGSNVRSLAMQIGDSLPLYAGAAPQALFAFLPQAEQHALLDSFQADREPRRFPVPSRDLLERTLEKTRDHGYARSVEDVTLGIAAFATPVFNHRGELAAAISVSGLANSLLADEPRIVRLLREAAATTSARLGFLEGAAVAAS
ncbi:IclR family transcriptional regulator [Frondihabitans sp. PhB188]|uniref:IclR family transcriptional regulator n=1 Tax=Frondihabitans sp. PhB188 TaxID=2485200 RepID=UPI000F4622E4|nr:IclR family transcriptional regulator [Frondihabitans sp. PhB188]ROQ30302.1 IclR family transcriptional regulator [Frondihabitans sp. PhB188]